MKRDNCGQATILENAFYPGLVLSCLFQSSVLFSENNGESLKFNKRNLDSTQEEVLFCIQSWYHQYDIKYIEYP
ncbi:unnamed protein product [Ceutorhynchus assimilis]|uniref:Uncharacterized protein n=1 Tax=Ceutorhynchus assimilis TaxID=467358 RepID=A0A9N9MLR6_9CUCU|nr:unnamed protein product [Ceutorhynchus assimilis]